MTNAKPKAACRCGKEVVQFADGSLAKHKTKNKNFQTRYDAKYDANGNGRPEQTITWCNANMLRTPEIIARYASDGVYIVP